MSKILSLPMMTTHLLHSVAFTGHRYYAFEQQARLGALLQELYTEGFRHFISGMARGADLYFAEAVLALRETEQDIVLECARPCETQADSWPEEQKRRYQSILDRCDFEILVQHHYDRFCMIRRNRYMVDRSSMLLAAFDGMLGGTMYTIQYAMKRKLEVVLLDVTPT